MADIDIWASGAGAVIQEPTDAKKETGFVACEQNTVGEWNWLFNEITRCIQDVNSRVEVDTRLTNIRREGNNIVFDVVDIDGNIIGDESFAASDLINVPDTFGTVLLASVSGTSTNGVSYASGDPIIEFPDGTIWASVELQYATLVEYQAGAPATDIMQVQTLFPIFNAVEDLTRAGVNAASDNTGNGVTATGTGAASDNTGNGVTATGRAAAFNNTGDEVTATGMAAASDNTGNGVTATGTFAAFNNTGDEVTATGRTAAFNNTGNEVTATGRFAAYNNTGNEVTAIGTFAAVTNTGNEVTAIGRAAAVNNTFNNVSMLGVRTTVTGDNQVQLGDASTTTYVYGTVQNRSDERDKYDIQETKLGLEFVKKLRPVDYKWDYRESYYDFVEKEIKVVTEGEDGKKETVTETVTEKVAVKKDGSRARKRLHHGLIAQDVQKLIKDTGVDFGGFQDHSKNGGDDVMSIGYDELIAPLIKAIQELSEKVDQLQKS